METKILVFSGEVSEGEEGAAFKRGIESIAEQIFYLHFLVSSTKESVNYAAGRAPNF